MALNKRKTLANGVQVNYHRVVGVRAIVNVQNVIEVASYTSRAKREEERAAIASGDPMDVYVETTICAAPYDPDMTPERAYEWVKSNVEAFAGASDVLEAGQGEGVM